MGKIPKLPELFSDSIFFTYVTKSSPEDVEVYYAEKMKDLGWEPEKSVRERISEVVKWTLEHKRWIEI